MEPMLEDRRSISRDEFMDIIRRAYTAGVMAERAGKHEIYLVIDTDSLKTAFEGFNPMADLLNKTTPTI